MMKRVLAVLLMLCVLGLACQREPEPPPTPPPPEPTPEEIASKMRALLTPLQSQLQTGTGLTDEAAAKLVTDLQAARSQNQMTQNGKIACDRIAQELEDIVKQGRDAKRWRVVKFAIQAYEVMQPGSSKMARYKQIAELQLNRPKVTIKGFFRAEDTKDLYAFLTITNPSTGEVFDEKMREGEEKHGVKFNRVIGNEKGIEFEYLAIPGDFFDVMK